MYIPSRSIQNPSPLANTQLDITIIDLVAEYTLHHTFENNSSEPIEAVYSFPVPLDAVFMGMEAVLAGERLEAQIQARQQAEQQYDDAIADGDSALLLEWLEPGLLGVSLGNLMAAEQGEIILRFAAPLHCADGAARFSLPLVQRPRYGYSRLDPLMAPQHDFAIEHPLQATLRVQGLLEQAPARCLSHAMHFTEDEQGRVLRLKQGLLDRDLVLQFQLPKNFAGQARLVRNGNNNLGILSLPIPLQAEARTPLDLCLVMDCSGSMSGDAIQQSRQALAAVAANLDENDRIQVLRFGSSMIPMLRRPMSCTPIVLTSLQECANTLNADLGGTEMGKALEHAIRDLEGADTNVERNRVIVMVTDGAVHPHEVEAAREQAQRLGIRIFVVAVGSSAGTDVLAPLAQQTGAALERAVPAEPIDAAVMRQIRRARTHKPVTIEIDWGTAKAQALPLTPAFSGDAVMAIAQLPANTSTHAVVRLSNDPQMLAFELNQSEEAPALRSLAGHMIWNHANAQDKESLALQYGLITEQTSAILVKVRADESKAKTLPKTTKVPHMIPAGMVAFSDDSLQMDMPVRSMLSCSLDEPTLSSEQSAASTTAEEALLDLLIDALAELLNTERGDITLEKLLERLPHHWRDKVRSYLEKQYPKGFDRQAAMQLWQEINSGRFDEDMALREH